MYHFIYKTTSPSGKFYIGRHSTTNLDDGYLGSGKWIRSLKDKSNLKREILEYCNSSNELLPLEEKYLSKFIEHEQNMNFHDSSSGFAVGKYNPAHTIEGRKKRHENNWMRTDRGKKWISENNPSKRESVKLLRSEHLKKQWLDEDYRKKIIENHHSKSDKFKSFFSMNNPMYNANVVEKISKKAKEQYNQMPIISCPHCGKTGKQLQMVRWHMDRCKHK